MTTMLICSRGVNAVTNNMLKDLERLLPSVRESKHDQKDALHDITELMDMNECTSAIYFETTKRTAYVWVTAAGGPSVRFLVYNIFTMRDLAFPVNCEKSAGHRLVFDASFAGDSSLTLVKDLFAATFGESEVFDRVLCFFYLDGKIWMRIYVIDAVSGLLEMGPRIVLEIDKILEGPFSGNVLFKREK